MKIGKRAIKYMSVGAVVEIASDWQWGMPRSAGPEQRKRVPRICHRSQLLLQSVTPTIINLRFELQCCSAYASAQKVDFVYQITEGLLKKLDAIVIDRPSNLEKKKEIFIDPQSKPSKALQSTANASFKQASSSYLEELDYLNHSPVSSLLSPTIEKEPLPPQASSRSKQQSVEMERVRVHTELDRLQRYQQIAKRFALQYYEICSKLVDAKLDQHAGCQYIMDFVKCLLEYGREFGEQEFAQVYAQMKGDRLIGDEAVRCFTLVALNMGIDVIKMSRTTSEGYSELLNQKVQKQQSFKIAPK